jgi:hypothetical protein
MPFERRVDLAPRDLPNAQRAHLPNLLGKGGLDVGPSVAVVR